MVSWVIFWILVPLLVVAFMKIYIECQWYLKKAKNATNIIIKSLQIDMLVNIVSVIINKIY